MATNTAIAEQGALSAQGDKGYPSIYLEKLDSAVLTSVQEQLEKNRTIRR